MRVHKSIPSKGAAETLIKQLAFEKESNSTMSHIAYEGLEVEFAIKHCESGPAMIKGVAIAAAIKKVLINKEYNHFLQAKIGPSQTLKASLPQVKVQTCVANLWERECLCVSTRIALLLFGS